MIRVAILLFSLLVVAAAGVAYPFLSHGRDWLEVTWERPLFLFGLLIVPLVLWRTTYGRDRRTARLRMPYMSAFSGGPVGFRSRMADLPGVLRSVGLALCILALARPVSIMEPAVAEEEGIDMVVALDLSGSMRAVMENMPPDLEKYMADDPEVQVPTRLDAAKAVLRDFISRRKSDRIGVVVFGRSAYVVSPPTLDYQLLDSLVSRMRLELIDPNGTAIGDALGVAVARLRNSDAKSRAIVLLTDGDNKGGQISPEYAAHLANVIGAQVYPIQIGEGETAKVYRGTDLFGQPRFDTVAFPTNPELLRKLAETTDGEMYVAHDAQSLQASFHQVLNELEKTEFEAAQASYSDWFRYLLVPGVLLVFFELLLGATLLRRFP